MTITELEAESEVRRAKNLELEGCEESLRSIYLQLDELTAAAEKRSGECEMISLSIAEVSEENQALLQSNM